ncbi:MAG: YbhB/YbcL family Raf kinase inhibitor-like protein [Actinobacteria bacterium]|nr:YbhB/YbcL family Raf kinase inhibitor-like protein [Actinomycetota bacterium]
MSRRGLAALLALAAVAASCRGGADPPPRLGEELGVTSSAFERDETIPAAFTCDGEDTSPPLLWTKGPENTVSYAIVLSDPDGRDGVFIHWTEWGIDAGTTALDEGQAGAVGTVGTNGFGSADYRGPCPPEGDEPHRYRFTVYALSKLPDLPDAASWDDLLSVIDDFARAEGTLEGRYGR